MKRAVITGLGAVTPIGNNVKDYWANLISGKSGAAIITRIDVTNHKTKFACEVKGFDPLQYLDKSEVRRTDLSVQYTLAAIDECIKDSGLDFNLCNRNRIGTIIATGVGGIAAIEDEIVYFGQNGMIPKFSPFTITKIIPNILAGQVSIKYGLHGISYTLSSACASSNNAIANALDIIRLGRADVVFSGGSEAAISHVGLGGFNSMRALSTFNESPEKASRPFDKTRDGFVIGEGAGILMIEELEHALKRGAKIYCELVGYGAASDAYHVAISHPDGLGAILAMEGALVDAGLTPKEVTYINAHATSTPIGDISECKAIEKVFGDTLADIHVSATKSMTGHLLGAAGAIEAIACVKSIEENIIHPTINLDEVDPILNSQFDFIPHTARKVDVLVAMNNTFGFGGHTVSTIFKRYQG